MAISNKEEKQCVRCILSTNDYPDLIFDETGLCNHCRSFDRAWAAIPKTKEESQKLLKPVIDKIKSISRGKKYDCIIGVSGGVDSTYIALITKQLGLNPLAVHFDNGWNSELATINIEKIVSTLDIDLITYVIDWEEFKALQLAYLNASVIDIEVLTDHAIYGTMYKIAKEHDIKFIISGVNVATEYIGPINAVFNKRDAVNIKAIYREYGTKKLKSYPFIDRKTKAFIKSSDIEIIRILNLIPFDLEHAKSEIQNKLGWRDYEGKHFESIFTRFYQGYILPTKFGIDKRKWHLSNLICSGQITREEALLKLKEDYYPRAQLQEDKEFVEKKLGLTSEEFDKLMKKPIREHHDFAFEGSFFSEYPVFKSLRPLWNMIRGKVA